MTRRLRAVWGRIRATQGLGRDLGVLAGLLVLGLGAGGYILAHQRVVWPWAHRVDYRADFEAAPGISPGNGQEVRIAGVTVGEVSKAVVTEDGRPRLTLSLQDKYRVVYGNARAYLRPKSPLNDMYVLLDPGSPPAPRLKAGAVIPVTQTARPVEIDEVLSHLDQKARDGLGVLLAETDTALAAAHAAKIPGDLKAADGTLVALRPVVEALQTRRERIARLVTALADVATAAGQDDARLARLAASARTTLDSLKARDTELDATLAALPGFTADLQRSSAAVARLGTELDPALDGIRAAADRLPGALAGATGVVDRLGPTFDLAAPVASGARPLMADLRPFVDSARAALTDTVAWAGRLDPITANLVGHLPDVAALVYNTNSATSVTDANGPILRGLVLTGSATLTPVLPVSDGSGGHHGAP
ncbi:MAG TPA: MlaD family protein [Acidimicrobiia bacterium]|nr:MlaD family protein [Acidimicrobiia bacterium]